MSLDLRLLPFDCDFDGLHFSHTVLSCTSGRWLHDHIHPLEKKFGKKVPKDFSTFLCREGGQDNHYGTTQTTPYGKPLLCLKVEHLAPLASVDAVADNPKHVAIWAYLCALPGDTCVAIYWC